MDGLESDAQCSLSRRDLLWGSMEEIIRDLEKERVLSC